MKVLHPLIKIALLLVMIVSFTTSYAQNKPSDPVAIVKVKNRSEKNVNVIWPAFTGDVSQYVLERSIDARRFQEVSVIVAMFGNDEPVFEFNDRFRTPYAGPLYYRLRVEGLDGSVVYTPVTILKALQVK
jgi:hypothetical protein